MVYMKATMLFLSYAELVICTGHLSKRTSACGIEWPLLLLRTVMRYTFERSGQPIFFSGLSSSLPSNILVAQASVF